MSFLRPETFSIRLLFRIGGGVVGATLVGSAIFAHPLGIDHNPEWGARRFALFGTGVFFLIWAGWDGLWPHLVSGIRRLLTPVFTSPPFRWGFGLFQRVREAAQMRMGRLFKKPALIAVQRYWMGVALTVTGILSLLIYLWVFTAGTMSNWPSGSHYFYLLGEAFTHGQLHLLEEPSPELLAAENPY